MATNTTNFDLVKPAGSDAYNISSFHNGSMDKIDSALQGLGTGLAIISKGNTHAAVNKGEYVYVHGHGSLAEGLYKASSNIAANGTLSGSNLSAVSGGLGKDVASLSEQIGNHATTINDGKIALNRSANIVTMDILDGTYTTNNNGVLIAGTSGDEILLPSGYRPPNTIYLYDGTTNKPIQVRSMGKLVATCNNTVVRVSGCWITNNDMPS